MKVEMNKKAKSVIAVYAIVLVVYIIAFLIIPFHKIAASWISFAFTIISLAGSLWVCGYAFKDAQTLMSKIYGFPVFRVSYLYVAAQFIVGVIVCALAAIVAVPYWIALLLSIILLGAAAIGVIITDNTRDLVEDVGLSDKERTKNMSMLHIRAAGVAEACSDGEVKKELEKLAEMFRYSDPVTCDETADAEEQLAVELAELKESLSDIGAEDLLKKIENIKNQLNERNRICKMSK